MIVCLILEKFSEDGVGSHSVRILTPNEVDPNDDEVEKEEQRKKRKMGLKD